MSDDTFVQTMQGAMADYRHARAAGLTREEAEKGIEAVLRDAWPKPPSKFRATCDACDDIGWREVLCWSERRCGRIICARADSSHEHIYVVPCDCPKGEGKGQGPKVVVEDIASTMRETPKRKTFRRL
jgi:hypothetical protein